MDIKDAQKIHSIGHDLAESKVDVRRDFELDVAGSKVEGRDGDVATVPRWVGRIIQEAGLGTVEPQKMVTELKQALSKEKMMGQYELSALEPHFYIKLKEEMAGLERYDFDRVEDMMVQLFRKRRGKIVSLADSEAPQPDLHSKLTAEERVFYGAMRSNSIEFEKQVRGGPDE